MRVALAGFVLTVLLALGARADDWDYAAIPVDQLGRTGITLHLDKSNENDVEFAHDVTDVLKKYRDVKLEKENIALRQRHQPSREENPANFIAENLVQLLAQRIMQVLVENPFKNGLAIQARSEPKHSQHEENDVVSDKAPAAPPVAGQDHAGRCSY